MIKRIYNFPSFLMKAFWRRSITTQVEWDCRKTSSIFSKNLCLGSRQNGRLPTDHIQETKVNIRQVWLAVVYVNKKIIRKQRWTQGTKIAHPHYQYAVGGLLGNFSVNFLLITPPVLFLPLTSVPSLLPFFLLIAANYSLYNYKQKLSWQSFTKWERKGAIPELY